MKELKYSTVYFIGIGGIGMSALARFFHYHNIKVAGYDKTMSELTEKLSSEGILIHYEDLGEKVIDLVGDTASTLIVVTPAVPHQLKEWEYLKNAGYTILKRAAVLGHISENWKTLAVAGTHGKTTTSAMLAHVLSSTKEKCNAFLGGIDIATNTNLFVEPESPWMVVEADEYDRSFLQLKPFSVIITSTDADHLDIYKNKEELIKTFNQFAQLVSDEGKLIVHHSLQIETQIPQITYKINGDNEADYNAKNIKFKNDAFVFDVKTPLKKYRGVELGIKGIHNVENALAVIAMAESIGIDFEEIRTALSTFKGVKRRFELIVKKENLVYIDDYAHHPTAINRLLSSIRLIYENMPVYVIFQPHLYSRTKDFMVEFATELSRADEVVLMPIYPAREEPIDKVDSETLAKMITAKVSVLNPKEVLDFVATIKSGVVLTAGAGNIDKLIGNIQKILE